MSLDVECVLPCDLWAPCSVLCHGSTFYDLFEAAKDAHNDECFCSGRAAMDERVAESRPEGCTTVAWFFDARTRTGSKVQLEIPFLVSILPYPLHSSLAITLRGTDCSQSTLPSCSLTGYQDILSSPGVVWIDKTSCLTELCSLATFDPRLVLVRRPAVFEKTSFLAMAEFFYDVKHRNSPASRSALSSTLIGDFYVANTEIHNKLARRHSADL
ncbi:uncharacterized protein BT62DRAFT_1080478 [Guyanagaster necrorhizus]|uniref:Uncharacterized protein n=1 Tax=Guyanagaster necrorhizus TaxID=856835 RepID=A0A9P7VJ93_9AGAR|nr:uncharacterized protein BT62DRAFT_1080478 [Guyanagaster necrorhizus MCA 3950]KAG7440969.1 hypothetical protein BT62DRAFT_1080478 [Guyanagaster necrorhizus MCA 3950]